MSTGRDFEGEHLASTSRRLGCTLLFGPVLGDETMSRLTDVETELRKIASAAAIEAPNASRVCALAADIVASTGRIAVENASLRNTLARLLDAADVYVADQSGATDERCGLVQPVSVEEANELARAVGEAWRVLRNKPNTHGEGPASEKER